MTTRTALLVLLFLGSCLSEESPSLAPSQVVEGRYTYSILGGQKQLEAKGKYLEIAFITQTPDMSTCQQVHQNKNDIMKSTSLWDTIEGECDDRASTNSLFAGAFRNEPGLKLYLSFKDLDGFETRVNFMGATLPAARALADMVIPEYRKLGIQDIRIIEPAP